MLWLLFPDLQVFSFHKFATTDMMYSTTTTTTFSYILMCPDISHGGHKSIRHQEAFHVHVGSPERAK
jgi:hypothetical protein